MMDQQGGGSPRRRAGRRRKCHARELSLGANWCGSVRGRPHGFSVRCRGRSEQRRRLRRHETKRAQSFVFRQSGLFFVLMRKHKSQLKEETRKRERETAYNKNERINKINCKNAEQQTKQTKNRTGIKHTFILACSVRFSARNRSNSLDSDTGASISAAAIIATHAPPPPSCWLPC